MGSGPEQARLWGPGARDWSDYNEPMCTRFYQAVLDATHVGPGTMLLDVGCGGGFALLLAARRAATVTGLDITQPLLDIARERGVIFAELSPFLPPAPPSAPGSIAWSRHGQLQELARRAGLVVVEVTDVANPLIYPDLATAVRTQLSSGPARRAIDVAGLAATRGALTRAFACSRRPDGSYRQDNVFRYLVARVQRACEEASAS